MNNTQIIGFGHFYAKLDYIGAIRVVNLGKICVGLTLGWGKIEKLRWRWVGVGAKFKTTLALGWGSPTPQPNAIGSLGHFSKIILAKSFKN